MAGLLAPARPDADDPVSSELRLWAAGAFDWRRANCALSALDYAERATGRTVVPSPRNLRPSAMAAIASRPDDFAGYCRWAMAQLGCEETDRPARGDVGLVELAGGLTACLALSEAGTMWAARGERGIVIEQGLALAAWRVPCRQR